MRPAVAAAVLALATGCSDAVPLEQWQGAVEVEMRRVVWRDADGVERSFAADPGWDYNPALQDRPA